MQIFKKKLSLIAATAALATLATNAAAHPGAHLHPHDGAHWLAMVGALAVLALAGGLAAAKVRSRK